MSNQEHTGDYFKRAQNVLIATMTNIGVLFQIDIAAQLMVDTLKHGGKILSCGNGGSMCDAIHFASELSGKYKEFREPLAAVALSDIGAMTCISNDFGYESVFGRQVRALGKEGDILLAISTSGTSKNIISAINAAKIEGMQTVILTGDMGYERFNCGAHINVPSKVTSHIQEVHIKIIHILVELIEQAL